MDPLIEAAIVVAVELGLFAAVLFAIFGIDDLLVDALRMAGVGRSLWPPVEPNSKTIRRFAIFIPAWREGTVIGAMLRAAIRTWGDGDFRIYVGIYPNDIETMIAVSRAAMHDERIAIIINRGSGPTTKGACLDRLWQACHADQARGVFAADAVLLHDAEDVVDASELSVLSDALAGHDYAQLPVVPMADPQWRWIAGHYCDEFAEAHGKDLPVRAALGVPLPLAGVGCAFRVEALSRVAGVDGPFGADCLTEDYELGLRLSAKGMRGTFVRRRTREGRLVASRGYFPHQIDQAVRQKTRWLRGISLEAWDRLGWIGAPGQGRMQRLASLWMLWRDRRAVLAALAILCGYTALILTVLAALISPLTLRDAVLDAQVFSALFAFNFTLLLWRMMARALCVARVYGWRHAPLAIVRVPIGNILLVMTAWRALIGYWRGLRGKALIWDKTAHRFPLALQVDDRP